jgi:hypothetical protein
MGSIPYRMYDVCRRKKKLGVCWGLFGKISPAFELRNPDVPAVVRQVIPAVYLNASTAN